MCREPFAQRHNLFLSCSAFGCASHPDVSVQAAVTADANKNTVSHLSKRVIRVGAILLLIGAAAIICKVFETEDGVEYTSSTSFDFYVLSMSYQPQFCYQHRSQGYAGCEDPDDFWRGNLTIHGLWPQVRPSERMLR